MNSGTRWGAVGATLAIAACTAATSPPAPPTTTSRTTTAPRNAPTVDASSATRAPARRAPSEDACLASARAGTLVDGVPPMIDGFKVMTKDPNRVSLVRGGRAMTDAEGDALWRKFEADQFGNARGLTTGSHIGARCAHVPTASCFHFSIFACQLPPEELVSLLKQSADATNVGDAEVEVVIEFREPRGPTCKDGPACTPGAHYSRKDDVYDPKRSRAVASPDESGGVCKDDGDCEAGRGNLCQAWQLSGGPQDLLYIRMNQPTFCGCIEGTCRWFTQP